MFCIWSSQHFCNKASACASFIHAVHVVRFIQFALFFGIAHGNLHQACYAFFFGVFLAFLARATGSVTAGFFSHALFNSLEVLFMYSIDRTALTQTQQGLSLIDILQAQGVSGTMWVSLILALIVFAGFAALLSALAFFLITRIRKIESAAAS